MLGPVHSLGSYVLADAAGAATLCLARDKIPLLSALDGDAVVPSTTPAGASDVGEKVLVAARVEVRGNTGARGFSRPTRAEATPLPATTLPPPPQLSFPAGAADVMKWP
jgi:hypothetical protein